MTLEFHGSGDEQSTLRRSELPKVDLGDGDTGSGPFNR